MSNAVAVTDQTFETEVLKSPLPVLVDFWAAWCAPCRMLAPIVVDVAWEYAGRMKVAKVDVDEYPALAARYQIRSIPTLLLFRDGQVLSRIGYMSKVELARRIDAAWNEGVGRGTAAADA